MKLRSRIIKTVLPVIAMLFAAGCYNDKADLLYPEPSGPGGNTCDTANMSYTTHIRPITDQYCATASCHNTAVYAGNYDFTVYADMQVAATNGRLLGAINHQSGFIAMPQGMPKLSDCNINKITAWINQGALNN